MFGQHAWFALLAVAYRKVRCVAHLGCEVSRRGSEITSLQGAGLIVVLAECLRNFLRDPGAVRAGELQ